MRTAILFCFIICTSYSFSPCTITGQTNGKMIHAENGVDTIINGQAKTVIYVEPGQALNEVFQIKVPVDTIVDYNGNMIAATINDMTIDNLSNLPPGTVHACNPSACIFPGNSTGCVAVSGTVNIADTGLYIVNLDITADVIVFGMQQYNYIIKETFLEIKNIINYINIITITIS